MSRFTARFQKLDQKNNKKPNIGFYIMSEYPNYQLCLKLLKKCLIKKWHLLKLVYHFLILQ